MRADMTPEEVRAAGIYLNGGRRRGWKRRLSALLDTSEATISAWATRSRGNARPISGVASVAIKLLVAMMRQELMVTAQPSQAGDALAQRVAALVRRPDAARAERPIAIGAAPGPVAAKPAPPQPVQVQLGQPPPAQWLGIQNPQTPEGTLPFGIKPRRGGSPGGRPGSSA